MKQMLRDVLEDCSTGDAFCFSLHCGVCGSLWRSEPIPFSKAGVDPPTEGKRIIYEAIYQREKARARELAAKEGEQVFNICPICGRLACNDCFLVCDDLDMCGECASRLNERGDPVGNAGVTPERTVN